jgi:fructokinase
VTYAVVVGEALVDLIETPVDGETVFRPIVGGAPLNVAAGLARLGASAELVTSVSVDALGQRIWSLLARLGVGTRSCRRVAVPTTLAVTSLRDAVPEFTFYNAAPSQSGYGDPPSFGALAAGDIDYGLVANASTLYCGSIALLYPGSLEVARAAWSTPGPLKVLDPNVRPRLLTDLDARRDTIEDFASHADLVKLSEPDASVLFDRRPATAARHLRSLGARAVVVTLGPDGAYADTDAGPLTVSAPPVEAIDTTGAGDACVAALMYGLLKGWPVDAGAWRDLIGFATTAASLACTVPGGATAMPTVDAIHARREGSTDPG